MTTFWDLPKKVREEIYRLHLVQQEPVDYALFKNLCGYPENDPDTEPFVKERIMPLIFQASRRLEKEASHIFFGENTFLIAGPLFIDNWIIYLWPRHARQIRSIYITEWAPYETNRAERYDTDDFGKLASILRLRDLIVAVDEMKILEFLIRKRSSLFLWHASLAPGPQMYLNMWKAEGLLGLMRMRGLERVEFVLPGSGHGRGSIPGGLLETVVKRVITQSIDAQALDGDRQTHFRFLDLPPELRNKVYATLLVQSGAMFPRTERPTSSKSGFSQPYKSVSVPYYSSVLAILRVNRQINKEAYHLFYKHNDFVFAEPGRLQLFLISLGRERLDCLRNVTLFYRNGPVAARGKTTMDMTLSTLRFLKNLRKLHILIPTPVNESDRHRNYLPVEKILDRREANPATMAGAKTLFSLRNLTDIKVFPPPMAEDYFSISPHPEAEAVERMGHAFEHFNYGLRLAQTGRVCHRFYEDPDWMDQKYWQDKKPWPALDTQTWVCGRETGCVCWQNSGDEASEDDAVSS